MIVLILKLFTLTGIMEPEASLPPGHKHAMSLYPEKVFSYHPHNLPPPNL